MEIHLLKPSSKWIESSLPYTAPTGGFKSKVNIILEASRGHNMTQIFGNCSDVQGWRKASVNGQLRSSIHCWIYFIATYQVCINPDCMPFLKIRGS